MKKVLIIITLFIFISCSNNASEIITEKTDFSGLYKIESIVSTENVDLNDDNISSTNLMNEIPNYFENADYDFIIRNLEKTDPYELLLSIYLPVPNEFIDEDFGLIDYNRYSSFIRINPFSKDKLINEEMEISNSTILNEMVILDNNIIESKSIQIFYDFSTNNWRNLEIKIRYLKLE
ncbi:MAG: hypothetical protein L3J14_08660 [Flavobacteriaceae bacterium]|nr:hypothetical protein [Flavobacteriaceae bacterium]